MVGVNGAIRSVVTTEDVHVGSRNKFIDTGGKKSCRAED